MFWVITLFTYRWGVIDFHMVVFNSIFRLFWFYMVIGGYGGNYLLRCPFLSQGFGLGCRFSWILNLVFHALIFELWHYSIFQPADFWVSARSESQFCPWQSWFLNPYHLIICLEPTFMLKIEQILLSLGHKLCFIQFRNTCSRSFQG